LRDDIEDMRRELEAQLATVEAQTRRADGGGPVAKIHYSETTEIRRGNILGSISPTV